MVVLGLKNFVDLLVDPVNLDILALDDSYSLCHLKDCLLKNSGGGLSLES